MINVRQFLLVGGVVFIITGLLGLFGVAGPTFDRSIFGETWVFTRTESIGFIIFGGISLIALLVNNHPWQTFWVTIIALVTIFLGIYSIFQTEFLAISLERPMDLLTYILIASWAISSLKNA